MITDVMDSSKLNPDTKPNEISISMMTKCEFHAIEKMIEKMIWTILVSEQENEQQL